MKKTLLTILQYVLFLGLGIWIVYHMLHSLSPSQTTELVTAIKSINAWYLVPICIVGFLSHLFRALRWRYLLETVDLAPSVVNTTFAVLIGYFANLALPRAGEVAKCTVLAKYERAPAHKMIGTIVAERAFDVICLATVAFFSFLLQIQVMSAYVSRQMAALRDKVRTHQGVLVAGILVLVAIIIALTMVYRRHKETKMGLIIKEMSNGIFSIIHMKKRWQFLGYTFLIWLMYVSQIYLGFKSLPPTHHLTMLTALIVLVYGSVAIIITPGGIGMYTLMVAQILNAYAIDDVPAQAFGWISWAVQTAIIILLGTVSLLTIHSYNTRKYAQAAMDTTQSI
jgi:glycosyltransferase 2 family protein